MLLLILPLLLTATALAADSLSSRAFPEPPKPSERVFSKDRSAAGTGTATTISQRDREYARGLLSKYDKNGDRVLQKEEWSRIKGSPEKADSNGDSKLTFDELVARVSARRLEKANQQLTADASDRRSQRLTPPAETLPDGLPGWFRQKDKNGDGQVAMHEYASRWTKSTTRKFEKLDQNDDGLITPDEAAR